MKATGEVMAIDRSFEGALQKAVRSLEIGGRSLLWEDSTWKDNHEERPLHATDERLWSIMAALRRGRDPLAVSQTTGVDMWFLDKLMNIIAMEMPAAETLTPDLLRAAKRMGFRPPDRHAQRPPPRAGHAPRRLEIRPAYNKFDTRRGVRRRDAASTARTNRRMRSRARQEGVIIGSGPIRIGQERARLLPVHAAWALNKAGYRSIMVNSNPETVSTDSDTSDRL
jgi:carbamoyl-phosphate synthase large subunit